MKVMRTTVATVVAATLSMSAFSVFAEASLTGAGATFPAPVYAKWADTYQKETGNASKMGNGAGDVDAAAPGFEHRCGTAQFSFGINLRGNCCAIERGRKCQRIDTYHHFLL